jgi:hypothetical protein
VFKTPPPDEGDAAAEKNKQPSTTATDLKEKSP